jgi:MFS family permease
VVRRDRQIASSAPRLAAARTTRWLVVFSGLHLVLFPIPIITLFWKDHIGMSLADIMTLQALFALAAVIFEFPSGYVADRVGRRAALLTAAALWVIGWSAYCVATTFWAVAGAEIVLGAGMAFGSGADSALLFTSLEASGGAGTYARWEGRMRAASQVGESASSAVGGALYAVTPRLPFWLQVPVALTALAAVLRMRETREREGTHRVSHLREACRVLRHTLGHHRRLRSTIFLSVALGLPTFVMVWLIQPCMQQRGIPAVWFGPLWAGAHLYLAGVSLASARVAEICGRQATLLGCCLLIGVGYVALGATTSAAAVGFYLCFMTVRGLQAPLLINALQHDAPAEYRASILSINAMLFRLSFVLLGPPVGRLVDTVGLRTALLLLSLGFSAVSLTALATFRRAHRNELTARRPGSGTHAAPNSA